MNLKKFSIPSFSAQVTLGLERGYTKSLIKKSDIVKYLQQYQNKLIKDKNLMLSVSLSDGDIVLSGQVEPHIILNVINYPKFPIDPKLLKIEIENLTRHLMNQFEQNRVVIAYLDETVMLENSEEIDPRIQISAQKT